MSPFAPRGDKSLRVIVTEMAADGRYNDVITFEQLGKALDLDPDDVNGRNQIRQAVSTARPVLLKRHGRVLISDRGRGYRIGRPGEYAGVAEAYRDRGQRQFTKALAVIEHAPEADMTPEELRRHRAVGVIVRNLNSRLNDAEQRLSDLEDTVHKLLYGDRPPTIQGEIEA